MTPRITSLAIDRFRSLRQFKIEGLGRVNLITGRNNTGKSSILEALQMLASDASPRVLFNILRYREEVGVAEEMSGARAAESLSQLGGLFTGFPRLAEIREAIAIAANGGESAMRLTISVRIFLEQREPDGLMHLVEQQAQLLPESTTTPALVTESHGAKRILPLDVLTWRFSRSGDILRRSKGESCGALCLYRFPHGGGDTASLVSLWDKHRPNGPRGRRHCGAKNRCARHRKAVSMVGGEGLRLVRTAIVRSREFVRPVPLRSFGDGLNRVFGIVLSLVNAKDGFLLIERV